VIAGLRPEDFEDAGLVSEQNRGITFEANIEVVENMGSEFYVYFTVEAEKVSSQELEELAHDAGAADLPQQEGNQVVARLDAASNVRQGTRAKLWFNADHLHLFDPESGQSLLGSVDGERSGGSAAPSQTASGTGAATGAQQPQQGSGPPAQ
jgi:multiple sugar transport system ATP-binding protein